MRRRIGVFLSAVLLAGLWACGDDSESPFTPPPSSEHRKVVEMRDNSFSPRDLTVSFGDTVEWVNVGNNVHTTTSGSGCVGDGTWDSGSMSKGGRFMVIFDADHVNQTGAFPYFCVPHCALGMTGSVTVNP